MAYGESFRNANLVPGMALGELYQNTTLSADDTQINVYRNPFLRLSSDNTTSTNRTFTLTNGAVDGQILYINMVPLGAVTTGRAELASTGNVNLTGGTWSPAVNDVLMLQWDATSTLWREITRTMPGTTGTGSIVYSTSPTIVTPTLTNPTVTTGTFATPAITSPTISGTAGNLFGTTKSAATGVAGTNVASITPGVEHYIQVGAQVFVQGVGTIASTAAASTASAFTLSLPVASNLGATGDLSGSGVILSATGTESAPIIFTANTGSDLAAGAYNAAQTASATFTYQYTYTVI